jgi:hypothetical protein
MHHKSKHYSGIEIVRYPNTLAYVYPNDNSDKLIIIFGETGWQSILKFNENNGLSITGMTSHIFLSLRSTHTFLIPEKLKREPGLDYSKNMEDRAYYTAENLISCYAESINGYLGDHEFSSVVLIGSSEGAMLLPLVYEKMNNKEKITAMISINYGGLSLYESYKILSTTRSGYPEEWVAMFADMLTVFDQEKTEFPDSFEED